jgi:gamma-glutamyltranspeptidase/glutathione hydrolase
VRAVPHDARPVSAVTARGGVAVTPHALATQAAIDVLLSGGNAADAAIAANATLGTVLPTTCGIGGDLFALVHGPGMGAPEALNASGRGGSGLDAAELRAAGHVAIPPRSVSSITAPGCVDGWEALAERHGTRPLGILLADAISHAERGFEVSLELADDLERIAPIVGAAPSAPELYPDDRPPRAGTELTRPGYAAVLAAIAEHGRVAFYEGRVADAIVRATEGRLTAPDLARRQADWVAAIGLDVFGHTLWTTPPNSQGYLTAAATWLLEHFAMGDDPGHPAFHHAVVESYRAVAWERNALVADPDHLPLTVERLLDPNRFASRLDAMSHDRVAAWPAPGRSPGGTAYLCVVDAAGMAVSLIQSNFTGIGSGISAGDTGVWLHNRGAGFSLEPGHPNEAHPGKRPLHTLSPTLWTRGGSASLVLGTRGGHQQPQYLLQVAALLHLARLEPAEVQSEARWHIDAAGDGGASVLLTEARMPEVVVVGLTRRGHAVSRGPAWSPGWGPVSVIAIAPDGTRRAAADPRASTAHAAHD